ncbi:hypothetical protein BP00DRAFT_152741 [Aspergillus indologenus CBS 114.80]|uniref:Uncharacterized protein n=1 Tax=Aspergillus indologenus CBS 114.80 TaxID=1450541 RepID=A0A2V5IM14_9EURO|nr:hypothetical protein BP00DRAFT_152741 [Aspergillus indologenus CBS 114.80]
MLSCSHSCINFYFYPFAAVAFGGQNDGARTSFYRLNAFREFADDAGDCGGNPAGGIHKAFIYGDGGMSHGVFKHMSLWCLCYLGAFCWLLRRCSLEDLRGGRIDYFRGNNLDRVIACHNPVFRDWWMQVRERLLYLLRLGAPRDSKEDQSSGAA